MFFSLALGIDINDFVSLVNDVSLLFGRLDENNDGQITLNELWKHSMIYKVGSSLCKLVNVNFCIYTYLNVVSRFCLSSHRFDATRRQ